MIREGRQEGWLSLPSSKLPSWATLNGVKLRDVEFATAQDKGAGVVAKANLQGNEQAVMTVPRQLILSLESVEEHAKSDKHLREVLDALDEFGRTTRGAILVFLLMQATMLCPQVDKGIGARHPLTEYIAFLPEENLPTFWTDEEREALRGTSLQSATDAKFKSLSREFDRLREATGAIAWCRQYWWNNDLLTFDDWRQVDAMYRSRALEFPGIGDSMAPVIDMANHKAGNATGAIYETDGDGNGVLLLRPGQTFKKGEEITITYGDEKGACEMIFSYGFLDNDMTSAKVVFLDLQIDDDDPFKAPKNMASTSAPGVRVFETDGKADWESDYIYLTIVNEEDGLHFDFKETTEGKRELEAFWKDEVLPDTAALKSLLAKEPMWDIFRLRAVSLIQLRVDEQLEALAESNVADITEAEGDSGRPSVRALAEKLHALEKSLLEQIHEKLEEEKAELVQSEVVQAYLGQRSDDEDDFA